jgi:aryl sulfotransferase
MSRVYQNAIMDSTRWEGFAPRDGDIIIATSYKAGTTWMQGICAALVFQQPTPPVPQDELSPWLDAKFAPVEEILALLEGLRNRRYIKTHQPMDGLPYFPNARYVFVGRDGLDVFMSLWNHWNNMSTETIDELNAAPDKVGPDFPYPPADLDSAFDDWISKGGFSWEGDGWPFWSHLGHADTFWQVRDRENVLFVHFQDLLDDLDGEMRRVSEFLGIPVDEARWPELLRGVGFDSMKANAEAMAPGGTRGIWKDTANFFHKGTNRRWEGVLSPEQIAAYRVLSARRLSPELDTWLAQGRRATATP